MTAIFRGMPLRDRTRERRIEQLAKRALSAPTPAEARLHLSDMAAEIAKRSPDQVRRMEESQGLA